MASEIILPKLGQTMEEGTIVEWLKNEGEPVNRGDVLFTVESDKAVLEVEATARGFLRRIFVPEGHSIPVLTVVGLITRTADERIPEEASDQPVELTPEVPPAQRPKVPHGEAISPQSEEAASRRFPGRTFASPRARRAAREKGLDLDRITGTGPEGRIVEADVMAFWAALPRATPVAQRTADVLGVDLTSVTGTGRAGRITKADVQAITSVSGTAPSPETESTPMTGLRRIIAERMSRSHTTVARVTLVTEADATALVAMRQQLKNSVESAWGFAPGYNDLLGLIVARSLREFPYVNARYSRDGESIERLPRVNLGMAVDTDRGLLVPVVRDADTLGLRAFAERFRALAERARAGKSLPDDLADGTFTITNLGMYEIDAFTPIINLPEAAILGVGRIRSKPVALDGEVVVRDMWTLSLAFDHRLVDGAPAARFLQRIKRLVESPYLLLA